MKNYLTIDVEDYFQVSAFEHIVKFDTWGMFESRVVKNTRKLLQILSDAGDVKATFFILGWVAERHQTLVKEICMEGHEIACHSYQHKCIYNLTPADFKEDTMKAKKMLEDITGKSIAGYRAPSYSITENSLWAIDILKEAGFNYDSSIFPIMHDRYGIPGAPRFKNLISQGIWEYPISTAKIFGMTLPVSGGGYFRILPYSITSAGLHKINTVEHQPFVFYLHPWELDPEQPRLKSAGVISTFRHYHNLEKTEERFKRLLSFFSFGPITNQ